MENAGNRLLDGRDSLYQGRVVRQHPAYDQARRQAAEVFVHGKGLLEDRQGFVEPVHVNQSDGVPKEGLRVIRDKRLCSFIRLHCRAVVISLDGLIQQ